MLKKICILGICVILFESVYVKADKAVTENREVVYKEIKEDKNNGFEKLDSKEKVKMSGSKANKKVMYKKPLNVPLINQFQGHYLRNGCEVTSLAMVLNYHGIKVTKTELFNEVDKVPWKYKNGMHGNPNVGFVGDMEKGPGLSVYHKPMMKLAKRYVGNRVVDLTGSNMTQIYKSVDSGLPVWVITTATFNYTSDFKKWNTSQGKINVTFNLHSVVITGHDEKYVYINNPFGKKNQKLDRKKFEKAWKQLGSQAIVINKK